MGLRRLCRTAALNVNVSLWDNLCMWAEGGAQISKVALFCASLVLFQKHFFLSS